MNPDTRRIALEHVVGLVKVGAVVMQDAIKTAREFEAYLDYRDMQASQVQCPPPSAIAPTVQPVKKADW